VTAKSKGHLVDIVATSGGSMFADDARLALNCSMKELENMVKKFPEDLEWDETPDGKRIRLIQ
jgi:hypothetical protein